MLLCVTRTSSAKKRAAQTSVMFEKVIHVKGNILPHICFQRNIGISVFSHALALIFPLTHSFFFLLSTASDIVSVQKETRCIDTALHRPNALSHKSYEAAAVRSLTLKHCVCVGKEGGGILRCVRLR